MRLPLVFAAAMSMCFFAAVPARADEVMSGGQAAEPAASPSAEKPAKPRHKPLRTPATRLTAQMERDLALDSSQAEKVAEINRKDIEALQALRPTDEEIKQTRRKQREIMAERDKALKAVLTDRQYRELTEIKEKYEKRMRNMAPAEHE
jgi:hypothetical protein